MAIKRGKELAKEKSCEQDRILKIIIYIYEKDNMSQTDINKLTKLQSELENVYQYLVRGAFIRSRRRWMKHGERNTKYFHCLAKTNATLNNICT